MRILSLGAGVQSTTIALMIAAGELPMVDRAIFADTKREPKGTYAHLASLTAKLPYPVDVVSHGDLGAEILAAAEGTSRNDGRPPFFVKNADGGRGILRRQCTSDYKIDVIRKRIRELAGVAPGRRMPAGTSVTEVIGISYDERGRMKASPYPWLKREYPLVDSRTTRWDCEQWLKRNRHPVPSKSACTFCPYLSKAERRNLRDNDPEAWADAVRIDRAIRSPAYVAAIGECYVSDLLVPLEDLDLSTDAENGQINMWDDECDGMCGV